MIYSIEVYTFNCLHLYLYTFVIWMFTPECVCARTSKFMRVCLKVWYLNCLLIIFNNRSPLKKEDKFKINDELKNNYFHFLFIKTKLGISLAGIVLLRSKWFLNICEGNFGFKSRGFIFQVIVQTYDSTTLDR